MRESQGKTNADTASTSAQVATCEDPVSPPLAVDLDGTLFRTNLLFECVLRLVKQNPRLLPLLPFWLLRGKAHLKKRAFEEVTLNYRLLPLHHPLVEWLREEKARGRHLILATAANQQLAEQAVAHLGLFEVVLGSNGENNLNGPAKAAALQQICGSDFAYAGNSRADQAVWKLSREAVIVNAGSRMKVQVEPFTKVTKVFPRKASGLGSLARSLRFYQWLKNLLIFVPAFTSHKGIHWQVFLQSLVAFVAFSLCASGTYVVNDLLDLEEDRAHDNKKSRPFASGECSIPVGILAAAVCFVAGMGVAFASNRALPPLLLLYIVLATAYSAQIKRVLLLDILTLAILYTLRVIVGHVVTDIPFSVWLLSFAFFLFLSLAFSKRAAELFKLEKRTNAKIPGRGYRSEDLLIITTAGLCSGFLSSLVFALYINSDAVTLLYRHPAFLWGILPLLLYYIVRIWLICGRGEMDDDPILYTAKSASTYYIAILVITIVIAATINF
jgi:4-hydroxybenzoate polyprenyltransferase